MRIVEVKIYRADGGWRPFSFLKLRTDESLSGWAEFAEGPWSAGLPEAILTLGRSVMGEDPRHYALLAARLHAQTQFTAGGVSHQAVAAIENACIEITAKASGLPVHRLFGGPLREAVELYWSHCGSFRVRHPELFERLLGVPRLETLEDLRRLGTEAVHRGFKGVKTNPILFGPRGAQLLNPGFVPGALKLERTADEATFRAIAEQAGALRDGLGHDPALMLDVNFAFRPPALKRIARALEKTHLAWLEADLHDPAGLASVRRETPVPLASLETLHGRRAYLAYLKARAADIAVVDVPWNGFAESVRIAALAEAFEVNVAPHNFYGPLADLMSAQFCGVASNVARMEIEGDDVPWKAALLTRPAQITDGHFVVPTAPGWGAEPDEQALAAHPWPEPPPG